MPTDQWQWRAGTADALNFSFHGVSSETASLTESATYRVTQYGIAFDVNSFTSSYQSSDSGHVVDDEPGVFEGGSGTTLFHRDEAFAAGNEVTGSGSYVGGSADASYHAVETVSFARANVYTVSDAYSAGYDEDGEPYELLFNYSGGRTAQASDTITHHFHDSGDGLTVTGESFASSTEGTFSSHDWGTRNGEAFDNSSVIFEDWSTSFSLPGEPGPVQTPSGMENAFLVRPMGNPGGVFFSPQVNPQQMQRPPLVTSTEDLADGYNQKIIDIGAKAAKKVADVAIQKHVRQHQQRGTVKQRGSGVFTLAENTEGNEGGSSNALLDQLGQSAAIMKDDAKNKAQFGENKYQDVKWVSTKVEFRYATENANLPKRSGNVFIEYRVFLHYTAKNKAGQAITPVRPSVQGFLKFHDANLENADLQP